MHQIHIHNSNSLEKLGRMTHASNTHTLTLKRSYTSCYHKRRFKQSSHHWFLSPHSTRKRLRHETTSMTPQVHEPHHNSHQKSLFYR
jgi:hypothetical protein